MTASYPIILGTAGHIDHGKTSLVKALTGIDCDRLKEEQRRGITIELGFAHLRLGETVYGLVDVPGHERFIKSMVAGATGIDLVMLVVAADEGVMPQTREHLDICQLIGVKRGLVALTKADLVDEEWRRLVADDLRKTLSTTFLKEAPIIPCSAISGLGLEEVRTTLSQLAKEVEPRDPQGLLRLPIDRVFSIKGFGTVVTGTLISGTAKIGDEVMVLPHAVKGKVRGLQVHGQAVEQAQAGQRTAINISGVERQEVERGEVLAHSGTFAPSSMIDAKLRLLPHTDKPLPARSRVLFHLGTRQQEGVCVLLDRRELAPGEEALVQLRFDLPVVALPRDHFILRGFHKQKNYGTTIGGGEVVRVLSPKTKPRDQKIVELLQEMASAATISDEPTRLALELKGAGQTGLGREDLQRRLPLVPLELERQQQRLTELGLAVRFDKESGSLIHSEHYQALLQRLRRIVDDFHTHSPLELGISREELRSRLGADLPQRLFFSLLQFLEKKNELLVERELCRRPGHKPQKAAQSIRPLAERLAQTYQQAQLAPPWEADLAAQFQTEADTISAALKILLDEKQLLRVGTLYFSRQAVLDLQTRLVDFLTAHGQITPQEFKELVGQSRKYTIPLAEYFDAQKVTLRVGDLRKLRR